jgi:hypothetical protein
VISPTHDSADGFFTDHEQVPPVTDERSETRQWMNDLSLSDSAFHAHERQPIRPPVGPLGMSRDSLNGTTTGVHFIPIRDEPDAPPPVIRKPQSPEAASIKIQRWYRKNRPRIRTIRVNEHRFVPS